MRRRIGNSGIPELRNWGIQEKTHRKDAKGAKKKDRFAAENADGRRSFRLACGEPKKSVFVCVFCGL